MASMQRLSLEQKTIIAKEFEYVMSSFNYLQVIAMMIYTVRTIIELNPSYNKYPDRFLSNYFGSSYFANDGFANETLLPFLRHIRQYILIWFVFKATTFYNLYYPMLKSLLDEEEQSNEFQINSTNTSDDEELITKIGISPMEDDFGDIHGEVTPLALEYT